MITSDFLRGRRREEMSEEDCQAVEDCIVEIRDLPARQTILRAGERPDFSVFLIEGFMCRYMDARDGKRQLVAIQVPGDFVDLHAYPLRYLDHDNATLSPCRVGIAPHARLSEIVRAMPHLTSLLWFSTLLDAAMHREWIFRLGHLDATGRVAHLFAETQHRLQSVGRASEREYRLPLTQSDLSEACGMTPVHLNRVLARLRKESVLTFRDGKVEVLDRMRLWKLAEFDPAYLF